MRVAWMQRPAERRPQFVRPTKFDFTKLKLNLVEKIEPDCHVRSSGPADPRPSQDGSPFKFCSPLDVVGFRGLSTCGREYELHFSEISPSFLFLPSRRARSSGRAEGLLHIANLAL